MIFDTHFFPLTLLGAALSTAIFAVLTALATERTVHYKAWAASLFISVLLVERWVMYYNMPAFQGTLGGYYPLMLISVVPGGLAGLICNNHRLRTIFGAAALAALLLCIVPVAQIAYSCFGPTNNMRYAALANVRVGTEGETVPPTEPNKMVQVSKNVAVFKGQTALTSTAKNLGSRFKINSDDYVLQSVRGHRYWIAPLVFANLEEKWWGVLFGNTYEVPGYVVVDAQDPNKEATVRLDFRMTLFARGAFHQNLQRTLYQQGFNKGEMVDVQFEVDDNWRPHWVVSYALKQFEGVGGAKIEKVIVVDVGDATPHVSTYTLGSEPDWIERVMPLSMVKRYIKDWGMWNNDYARANPWHVYFGIRRDESLEPSEFDLNYTTNNHSVWVIPMISVGGTNHAVAGVVVYDTRKNEAVILPNVRGFNTGNTVRETIMRAPVFLGKNLDVDQIQLYSIYGSLTWVAVITNPQSTGSGFAGVALLPAHSQNSAQVIFAPDMERALGQYSSQLALKGSGQGTGDIDRNEKTMKFTGRVIGFGVVPGTMQMGNVWTMLIEGDERIFIVSREIYGKVAMIKEGDIVSITYLGVESGSELAVRSLTDARLDRKPEAPVGK